MNGSSVVCVTCFKAEVTQFQSVKSIYFDQICCNSLFNVTTFSFPCLSLHKKKFIPQYSLSGSFAHRIHSND